MERIARSCLLWTSLALAGCNLSAAGDEPGAPPAVKLRLDGPLGPLQLGVRPGVSIWQAARRSPEALARLAAAVPVRLDAEPGVPAVGDALLREMLLPLPFGVLEVGVVQPEPPPPAAVTLKLGGGCPEVALAQPAAVGAYRAPAGTLLLRTDGRFVLERGRGAPRTGRFAVACRQLLLQGDEGREDRYLATGSAGGWRDAGGALLEPL
jgi:hypothetical protein